jgi:hypothetical protein
LHFSGPASDHAWCLSPARAPARWGQPSPSRTGWRPLRLRIVSMAGRSCSSSGRTPAMVFWLFVFVAGLLFGLYALLMWSKAVALRGGIAFRSLSRNRSWAWGTWRPTLRGCHPRSWSLSAHPPSLLSNILPVKGLVRRPPRTRDRAGGQLGHKIVAWHYAGTAERFNAENPAGFGQLRDRPDGSPAA